MTNDLTLVNHVFSKDIYLDKESEKHDSGIVSYGGLRGLWNKIFGNVVEYQIGKETRYIPKNKLVEWAGKHGYEVEGNVSLEKEAVDEIIGGVRERRRKIPLSVLPENREGLEKYFSVPRLSGPDVYIYLKPGFSFSMTRTENGTDFAVFKNKGTKEFAVVVSKENRTMVATDIAKNKKEVEKFLDKESPLLTVLLNRSEKFSDSHKFGLFFEKQSREGHLEDEYERICFGFFSREDTAKLAIKYLKDKGYKNFRDIEDLSGKKISKTVKKTGLINHDGSPEKLDLATVVAVNPFDVSYASGKKEAKDELKG